jgi:general stress protein 26
MKKDFDWKKHLAECISSTDYCCIATTDKKTVWANPVYFAWDSNLNIYFISQLHSRHMQNIKKNSQVAVSIYKTEQKGNVKGIQLEGKATILSDQKQIEKAFDIYYGRAGKGPDVAGYINNPTWLFVKIIPEKTYYFDTRFFGEERQEVPKKFYR